MALRREIMNYVGTGAIGGIIGYYARAQGLLGIKSEEVVRTPPEDEDQPPETEGSESPQLATFEDESLDSWQDTDNARITDQDSFSGNQSVVITDRNENGGIGGSIIRPVDSVTPNQLSAAFQAGDGPTPTVVVRWRDSQQNAVHTIRMSIPRNNIQYPNQQGRRPFHEGVETSNWYHVVLGDLDWEEGTVGEIKVNNQVVDEDVQFPSSTEPITSVQLRCHSGGTGMTAHFDDVVIG